MEAHLSLGSCSDIIPLLIFGNNWSSMLNLCVQSQLRASWSLGLEKSFYYVSRMYFWTDWFSWRHSILRVVFYHENCSGLLRASRTFLPDRQLEICMLRMKSMLPCLWKTETHLWLRTATWNSSPGFVCCGWVEETKQTALDTWRAVRPTPYCKDMVDVKVWL